MCGIFGIVRPSGVTNQDSNSFRKFFDLMNHRGPDGRGEFTNENVLMGMVRLSVIDLEHGWQPIWNEEKKIGVIANGEIYNYKELRNELTEKNHQFSTASDIETLIHLYEEYGLNFVTHLRGMFAFAIIDLNRKLVVLGRDRLGEKPLYVTESEGQIIFSSELRPLIQTGAVPFEIDETHISTYLQYGFVPEPYTLIRNVRKVQAGTIEIFDLGTSTHDIQTYWSLETKESGKLSSDASELRNILDDVANIVTLSDVPIGVALSSGIDSTLVGALTKALDSDLYSFTVGYSGNHRSDESDDAIRLAHSLGIKPHVVILDPLEVAQKFGDLCSQRDEPVADIAGAGYLALAELARSHGVKVLLTGQGADEIFWGYKWVQDLVKTENRRARLLNGNRNYLEYFRVASPPPSPGPFIEWMKTFGGLLENLRELLKDAGDKRSGNREVLVYERRPRARAISRISKSLVDTGAPIKAYQIESLPGESDVSSYVAKAIIETYLRSNGLGQMDRLSMAASVEARSPFVDYKLVEFAMSHLKDSNRFDLPPKSLLIAATEDLLPADVKSRTKKGFTPPVKEWYRSIFRVNEKLFDRPRIVELGLVNRKAIKILNSPLTIIGRPRLMWLELAVLEMWVRGLESSFAEEKDTLISKHYPIQHIGKISGN